MFQHLRRTEYTLALKTTKLGSNVVVVTPEILACWSQMRDCDGRHCFATGRKRSCGKVMFSEASVSHSVHMGDGTIPPPLGPEPPPGSRHSHPERT